MIPDKWRPALPFDIARSIFRNIMRAVLDTNVLVAGLSSRRGASHALLRHALNRRLRLLAGAEALVTFNRRDFLSAAARFALPLWTPAECLTLLETTS